MCNSLPELICGGHVGCAGVQVKHVLSLDHADMPDASGEDDPSNSWSAKTNMNWLTKSDLAGVPTASGIVLETIQQANRDVPEVTQVGRDGSAKSRAWGERGPSVREGERGILCGTRGSSARASRRRLGG
jgi:hypothetical protein